MAPLRDRLVYANNGSQSVHTTFLICPNSPRKYSIYSLHGNPTTGIFRSSYISVRFAEKLGCACCYWSGLGEGGFLRRGPFGVHFRRSSSHDIFLAYKLSFHPHIGISVGTHEYPEPVTARYAGRSLQYAFDYAVCALYPLP